MPCAFERADQQIRQTRVYLASLPGLQVGVACVAGTFCLRVTFLLASRWLSSSGARVFSFAQDEALDARSPHCLLGVLA